MALDEPPEQYQESGVEGSRKDLQIIAAVVIGVILLLLIVSSALGLLLIPIIIIALPIILIVKCNPRILKEQVIDHWDTMIGGGQGKGGDVIENTQNLILETRAPGIAMKEQSISPGLIRGLLGTKRPFLVVSNTANPNLEQYRLYINARDYGSCLQISWYLVQQPSLWQKAMAVLIFTPLVGLLFLPFYILGRLTQAKEAGILGLDIFDEQDLRAYVTSAHHCVLSAIESLASEHNLDISKVNTHSKGFLGIS